MANFTKTNSILFSETGCYEEGMTLAEMRSVINILNESREMHESVSII